MADASNELPLDVNYAKLAQWLVERRQLPSDWRKRLHVIQAKVAEASKQLPSGLLQEVLGEENPTQTLDYLATIAIRDKLAGTAEKTLFGGLAGPAGLWDKLCKAYEKQNVFLGEAALLLASNVDYEIPHLRKQAAKSQQLLTDLERKQADYVRSAASAARDFQHECDQLDLVGPDHVANLQQLPQQLPGIFLEAAKKLQEASLDDALQYYADFAAYAHSPGEGAPALPVSQLLPTLAEVRAAELRLPPKRAGVSVEGEEGGSAAPAIDWDLDLGGEPDEAPEISWDIDVAEGGGEAEAPAAVDWDIGTAEEGSREGALEIAWDIDTAEEGAAAEGGEGGEGDGETGQHDLSNGDMGESEGPPGVVERLVEDPEFRGRLLDEVAEVAAFLRQRLAETRAGGQAVSAYAPEAVQRVSTSSLEAFASQIGEVWGFLTSERVKQLLLIKSSRRFLTRLARGLWQRAGAQAKYLRLAGEVEARRAEVQAGLVKDAPILAAHVAKTGRVKGHVEHAMSSLFAGRKIHIIGEINTLIS